MHIQFTSQGELESALYWINEYFDDNIMFSKFLESSPNYWMVTLRCKDVNKVGHVLTRYPPYLRLPTACLHVHRAFIMELPDESLIMDGKHWYSRDEFLNLEVEQKYPCECEEQFKVYIARDNRGKAKRVYRMK